MGGISIWQLLIVLVIVLVLFGTKRIRSLGSDLGASVRGFRDAMRDGEKEAQDDSAQQRSIENEERGEGVIDGEVVKEKDKA
jgi:sec-independent protein translocase protein TatA